jgi:hypothetical protein
MNENGDFSGLYDVYTCMHSTPVSRTQNMSMYPCYVTAPPKAPLTGHFELKNKKGIIRLENICSHGEQPFQFIEDKNGKLTIKIDTKGCKIPYQTLYSVIRKQ